MAEIELNEKRQAILQSRGHVLIEGGPGCGKTTIALLKARGVIPQLRLEQHVLFLSFSRAAVRQVTDRLPGVLTRADRRVIEVRTFHAFFLEVVRSQGQLLTGAPVRFITPEREAQRRADHDGDWQVEIDRLARQESVFVFETLAPIAAELLERSADVRALYSARYPLVIVDEFQDTNRDQWRVIKALSERSTIVCLADPDQRIFDHLPGVDEHRIQDVRTALEPVSFDLSEDNHRSPGSGLLDYANAVLRNRPSARPDNVIVKWYRYDNAEALAHWAVVAVQRKLVQETGVPPTIAVLTRTNLLAARVSEVLAQDRTAPDGGRLAAIDHVLQVDPELTAAAALVVASVLEWRLLERNQAVAYTLRHLAGYYRTKLGRGTSGARKTITTVQRAIEAIDAGRDPVSKTAKVLLERFDRPAELTGRPVRDWQVARARLAGSAELDEINKRVRLLRVLRATDSLASALQDAWDGSAGYQRAADVVRIALAEDAVTVARQEPALVSVMNMHKSKGKEFDAVIIVEGRHQGQLLSDDLSGQEVERRLLRVAITRARQLVVFVRPVGAQPLTPQT
ncbi:DNA helicase-2/ATP-dependent DNA helicase PcrA [Kribbella aluminosa]|uniref:DNA helicase-2/ATP-dependent DNA helicase PcrA n=1 Tax=Kribbella aluminosa TaxID=416017 RepID=A0ABS4UTE7_9ACTN|nr:ATP-dependent helicase [Kribbella aluminosa]MBP2354921.1 DNA helicase-2/ATP-dependent DNA helicase PcrA [Kribbella aluminosa]